MDKNKVVLLIPALNPDEKMVKLVDDLIKEDFKKFFIVNDGSDEKYVHIFDEISTNVTKHNENAKEEEKVSIETFTHFKNFGKGRALKNAFNQIYQVFPDFDCVVTLDADGQHAVKDIINVAETTIQNPNSLVLGSREFGKNVPFRSKFGNILTRNVMKLFCGVNVRDTQTGLRGFSHETLKEFLDTPGERYEYEMNVLLGAKEKDIPIVEKTIETIYLDDNKSSHFNPIKDSIRIYSLFFKYIIASLLSFAIDIGLFALFIAVFKGITISAYIWISTILARVISSVVNFLVNKNSVFKSKNRTKSENVRAFVGYFILVAINMLISSFCVSEIAKALKWNETLIKLIVDTILFVLNFIIQREIIFKHRNKKEKGKEQN